MANTEFSNYIETRDPAAALDGTEEVVLSQGGNARKTTTQDIADLGAGGGGTVTSVTGTTDRITSSGGATPAINIDAAYDAAITAQIAAAAVGLWDDRGVFDASVAAYPSSGGSGTAGAILKGDIWTISVAGTLPTGQVVEIGDTVRALIDTPGNTQANWAILQNNIGYIPQNITNAAVVLTDAATIDLTAIKHTLTTASSRTFTISYTGDDISMRITLSAASAIQTFPAGALCISEGVPTGDNTCPMLGSSGDKYSITIKNWGSGAYTVICKNETQ